MMYPHSSQDEMKSRFSLTQRYKELMGNNSHRGDRALSEENPYWESDIMLNKSTNVLDRILKEAPANKRYALIPWKMTDRMDRKARATKEMIALHREYGFKVVHAGRHRKANLVTDRVMHQLDNFSSLEKKDHTEEVLHDEAIIIGENILMERDMEEHIRYNEMLERENNEQYADIGPNGKRNNEQYNDRMLGMVYVKEDEKGHFKDPSMYMNSRVNQLGY